MPVFPTLRFFFFSWISIKSNIRNIFQKLRTQKFSSPISGFTWFRFQKQLLVLSQKASPFVNNEKLFSPVIKRAIFLESYPKKLVHGIDSRFASCSCVKSSGLPHTSIPFNLLQNFAQILANSSRKMSERKGSTEKQSDFLIHLVSEIQKGINSYRVIYWWRNTILDNVWPPPHLFSAMALVL